MWARVPYRQRVDFLLEALHTLLGLVVAAVAAQALEGAFLQDPVTLILHQLHLRLHLGDLKGEGEGVCIFVCVRL